MAVQPLIHAKNVETIKKVFTWTAPAIAIPGLRYTQDSHQQRKELFIRDASTYSVGALTFFVAEWISKKTLDRFHLIPDKGQRSLAAFLIGLTANLLYAGIGAVRFSKAFSRYQAEKSVKKNALPGQYAAPAPASSLKFNPSSASGLPLPSPQFQTFPPLMPRMQYFA